MEGITPTASFAAQANAMSVAKEDHDTDIRETDYLRDFHASQMALVRAGVLSLTAITPTPDRIHHR